MRQEEKREARRRHVVNSRMRQKNREKNGTDLTLRMTQDNVSRENNDGDLFLQV